MSTYRYELEVELYNLTEGRIYKTVERFEQWGDMQREYLSTMRAANHPNNTPTAAKESIIGGKCIRVRTREDGKERRLPGESFELSSLDLMEARRLSVTEA